MMRAKLNEMSSQGWELVSVAAGVESADKERDAIFITRFFFKRENNFPRTERVELGNMSL